MGKTGCSLADAVGPNDGRRDSDLGDRGGLAGQAVTNSSVERFRLGERFDR